MLCVCVACACNITMSVWVQFASMLALQQLGIAQYPQVNLHIWASKAYMIFHMSKCVCVCVCVCMLNHKVFNLQAYPQCTRSTSIHGHQKLV